MSPEAVDCLPREVAHPQVVQTRAIRTKPKRGYAILVMLESQSHRSQLAGPEVEREPLRWHSARLNYLEPRLGRDIRGVIAPLPSPAG